MTSQSSKETHYEDKTIDKVVYAISNTPKLIRLAPLVRRTIEHGKTNTNLSLCDALLEIDKIYQSPITIKGTENIPTTGGFIFAVSHITRTTRFPGWLDKSVFPQWGFIGIAKAIRNNRGQQADLKLIAVDPSQTHPFIRNLANKLLLTYQGFPIDKRHPRSALKTLGEVAKSLRTGDIVAIAPEGEGYTSLTRLKRGVSRLATNEIPVLPVAFAEEIEGPDNFKHYVRIGNPLYFDSNNRNSKSEQVFADLIGKKMAEMLPANQRGEYA